MKNTLCILIIVGLAGALTLSRAPQLALLLIGLLALSAGLMGVHSFYRKQAEVRGIDDRGKV